MQYKNTKVTYSTRNAKGAWSINNAVKACGI